MKNFNELNLDHKILNKLTELNFTEPTEIQSKAIPVLLGSPKIDFFGQAQTGTGKTIAFGLPLLSRIDTNINKVQGLVVAPTRELAVQIKNSLSHFSDGLSIKIEVIYGGVSLEEQIKKLKKGVHLVVGTPGRINDHINRKTINFDNLKTLVLDEADTMLDMGFREEVNEILESIPSSEIWLFSATKKSGIDDLMKSHMEKPVVVRVSREQVANKSVEHLFCNVVGKQRFEALCRFVESNSDFYGFIFCQTKLLTAEVAEKLQKMGYSTGALHGDMTQSARNHIIAKFKNKELNILVATDVAARGIDISDLTHVINYSLPDDTESYIHRSGRTGRAGKTGIAITFISKSQMRDLGFIEKKFNLKFNQVGIPSENDVVNSRMTKVQDFIKQLISEDSDQKHIDKISEITSGFDAATITNLCNKLLVNKFLQNITQISKVKMGDSEMNDDRGSDRRGRRADDRGERGDRNGNRGNNNYRGNRREDEMGDDFAELYLNLGSLDGISVEDVKEHLIQNGKLEEDQVQKVRVINKRTFIKLPKDLAKKCFDNLKSKTICGRKARIEFVK